MSAPHLQSEARVGTQLGTRGPSPSPPASLPSLVSPREPPRFAARPVMLDQLEFHQSAVISHGLRAFVQTAWNASPPPSHLADSAWSDSLLLGGILALCFHGPLSSHWSLHLQLVT